MMLLQKYNPDDRMTDDCYIYIVLAGQLLLLHPALTQTN